MNIAVNSDVNQCRYSAITIVNGGTETLTSNSLAASNGVASLGVSAPYTIHEAALASLKPRGC